MENLVNCIELEDGVTYAMIDEIDIENNTYVYLVNIKEEEDFCIRKKAIIDNKEFLVGITEKEFDVAMLSFSKKHQNMLEEN